METLTEEMVRRQVPCRLPEPLYEKLRREAFERRVSMTELIRQSVEAFLNEISER